ESFTLAVGDTGPTGTVIANQSANEGQAFSLDVSSHFAAPAAGDTLTFAAVLPAGLSINAGTGVISGTPADAAYGSSPVTVTATDLHGKSISESFTLAVGDTGPTGTTIADQGANEGQAFSLDVSGHFAAPAAGDTLTFAATLPAGLSINAGTGVISGTPTDGDATGSLYGFNFASFDGKFTVTGQFTTGTSLDAAGGHDVIGITGAVAGPNGGTISSLISNPNPSIQSTSPDGQWTYDDVLYTGNSTLVDYGGVLFTSNSNEYNIYYANGQYILATNNPQGSYSGETGSFTISSVPANNPITVTATDLHGKSISESF